MTIRWPPWALVIAVVTAVGSDAAPLESHSAEVGEGAPAAHAVGPDPRSSPPLPADDRRPKERPRPIIERIVVYGNHLTDEAVIRSTIDLKPGDRLDPGVGDRQYRLLMESGLFREVHIRVVPGSRKGWAIYEITVKERRQPARISYELGYRIPYGPFASIDAEVVNLFGRGRRLGVRSEIGSHRVSVNGEFAVPRVWESAWEMGVGAGVDVNTDERLLPFVHRNPEVREGEGVYRFVRVGGEVFAARRLGRLDRVRIAIHHDRVEISRTDEWFRRFEPGVEEGAEEVGYISVDLTRDARTRENRGYRIGLGVRGASPLLLSSTTHGRLDLQGTFLLPTVDHHLWRISGRAAGTFGDVPFSERIQTSGSDRPAGTRPREVGPRGSDRLYTAEMRYEWPPPAPAFLSDHLRIGGFLSVSRAEPASGPAEEFLVAGGSAVLFWEGWGSAMVSVDRPLDRADSPTRFAFSLVVIPFRHIRIVYDPGG